MATRIPAPPALLDDRARASYGPVLPVLARLRDAGHEAWLVGGGLRDLLLGRPVADWDVATSAEPDAMLALWPEAVPTGARHGTVTLPLASGPVELTTYRSEGPYADGRRPDWVAFGVSLEEDLSRRDFTVNALALDPGAGILADPEGGREDLGRRLLRTVGDPDARFDEDGLRPLRGIRLAAVLEFSLDPSTEAALARAAERVRGVAAERVREELRKLLRAREPSRGLELLRTSGLLGVVLPELAETVGVPQNRYHAHDVWYHTLATVDAAPADDETVRWAALLHDVAKPRTRVEVAGEGTFHNHEIVGEDVARGILERLRFPTDDTRRIAGLVRGHMFHYTPDWSDAAVRRFLRRVGPENVEALFRLREADNLGSGRKEADAGDLPGLRRRVAAVIAREEALAVSDLAVGGKDVMDTLAIPPGPEVGRVLEELLEEVLEDPARNTRDALLARLRERARG